ncbi:hypothetical protein ACFT2C_04790 [Promicromonospora sp. NPDC057138]|uniref:hypothetical protein n=1 Tax=Promicromonospora sp. NPDC057138 TaxID=3346031 RepID=UPI00363C526E
MTAHARADATGGHRFLAQEIWHTAQSLGVPPGGHVLVTGQGSAQLVGTAPLGRHDPASRLWEGPVPWRARVPPRWPYPAYAVNATPEPAGTGARGPFAVQVISQVGVDVHMRSQFAWSYQQRRFHEELAQALDGASPGGLVFALASHSILDNSGLDDSDYNPWDPAGQVADFLGAARLPSHALRAEDQCDAPADLMIFRRRPPGSSPQPEFAVPRARWMPGTGVPVTTYYRSHRDHVLGLPMARTDRWDQEWLTVQDPQETWKARLPRVLDQIARIHAPAARTGITPGIAAQPASNPAPHSVAPARNRDRSPQATDRSLPHL